MSASRNRARRPDIELYKPKPRQKSNTAPVPSTSEEETETVELVEVDRSDTHAYVYWNDLIMLNIIGNVVDVRTRQNLEMASKRLLELSKKAHWLFNAGEGMLILSFTSLNSALSIRFDRIQFTLPCLTFENRRSFENIQDQRRKEQPEKLITLIGKLISKYGHCIKGVIVGGRSELDIKRGIEPHMLVVTKNLVEIFNKLEKLQSIMYRECTIDEDALKFMTSPSCTFTKNIENYAFNTIHLATPSDYKLLMSTLSTNTKNLESDCISLDSFRRSLLEVLENRNIRLDSATIIVNTAPRVSEIEEAIRKLDERSKNLHLYIFETYPSKNLFALGRCVNALENLRSFTMHVPTRTSRDSIDLSDIFEDLGHSTNLENLTVGGWEDPNVVGFLTNGIRRCVNLRKFRIINRAMYRDLDNFRRVFDALPPKIEELRLENLPLDMKILTILTGKFGISLKKLEIVAPKRCFVTKCFYKIIDSFEALESFSLDTPLPATCIDYILNNKSINEGRLVSENGYPTMLEVLMKTNFEKIKTTAMAIGPQTMLLEFNKRIRSQKNEVRMTKKLKIIDMTKKEVTKKKKEIW